MIIRKIKELDIEDEHHSLSELQKMEKNKLFVELNKINFRKEDLEKKKKKSEMDKLRGLKVQINCRRMKNGIKGLNEMRTLKR